jgi:hypothetical protein
MASLGTNGEARVVGVRLTDIDLQVRRRHGRILLERTIKELGPFGLDFAAELHKAVEEPTTKVYWVSKEAADRVLGAV